MSMLKVSVEFQAYDRKEQKLRSLGKLRHKLTSKHRQVILTNNDSKLMEVVLSHDDIVASQKLISAISSIIIDTGLLKEALRKYDLTKDIIKVIGSVTKLYAYSSFTLGSAIFALDYKVILNGDNTLSFEVVKTYFEDLFVSESKDVDNKSTNTTLEAFI